MSTRNRALERQLAALGEEFRHALPERLRAMQADFDSLRETRDSAAQSRLRGGAHRLAGAAGTFGMAALGEAARNLEIYLQSLVSASEEASDATRPPVSDAVLAAIGAHLSCIDKLASEKRPPAATSIDLAAGTARADAPVFVVDDDPALCDDLSEKLNRYGYATRIFDSPQAMLKSLPREAPCAVLLDLMFPQGMVDRQQINEIRGALKKDIPLLMISARSDLEARLHAQRSGCDAYLTKPIDTGALIDRLDDLSLKTDAVPWRVLLIEDDAFFGRSCQSILGAAGIHVDWLIEPAEVLTRISELRPDLILMDMYLPGCRGDELAAVIRQFDAWQGIPIVYLSVESVRDRQIAALESGGDDFLQKPIAPADLQRVVIARIRRTLRMRSMMSHDSLTGLLNHARFIEHLDIEVARAERSAQPLSVAMLDIDHFKRINDTYGHATGDVVIKNLARLLQRRLRQVDVIGRYGGEEFAILLPDTPLPVAVQLLDGIRQAFARQDVLGAPGRPHAPGGHPVTFSAGLASLTPGAGRQSPRLLLDAADQALYRAKHAGRNQVIATWENAS